MRMDKAAFSALHILPADAKGNRTPTSLLGFLNKCKTNIGMRMLESWLRQPLIDSAEITKRHDIVEALNQNQALLMRLQRALKNVPDLHRVIAKFNRTAAGRRATKLDDLYAVWRCLQASCQLNEEFQEFAEMVDASHAKARESIVVHIQVPLARVLQSFVNFIKLVEAMIDMDYASAHHSKCRLNASVDPKLQALSNDSQKIKDSMEAILKKTQKEVGDKIAVTLIEHLNGEQAMRVVKKNHQAIMSKAKSGGYESIVLKKSEFIFTTPELKKFNVKLAAVTDEYEAVQKEMEVRICKIGATYVGPIEKLSNVLAMLDVLSAFSVVCSCSQVSRKIRMPCDASTMIVSQRCLHVVMSFGITSAERNTLRSISFVQSCILWTCPRLKVDSFWRNLCIRLSKRTIIRIILFQTIA